MRSPANAIIFAVLVSLTILLSGCIKSTSDEKKEDGIDTEEEEIWGVGLSYLDDTNDGDAWHTSISNTEDHGVLLVNNTGNTSAVITLDASSSHGTVTLESGSIDLQSGEMVPVMITFHGCDGGTVTVNAEIKEAPEVTNATIAIICDSSPQKGVVGAKGDKVMVEYTLRDVGGSIIDSGTLPATVGERYVGPAQQLGYIEGFYMGLLGMRLPGMNPLSGSGETKVIKVPPELGYGTDPDGHELGGMTLYFTLTLISSI